MSDSDPVDVHRALQKAARELAFYADHDGYESEYCDAIDRLEEKLQAVRRLGYFWSGTRLTTGTDEAVFMAGEVLASRGWWVDAPEPPNFGDTCCGKCPLGTCYVDQMTGA